MTLENTYRLQARISALESLVIELLANQPNANAIVSNLEASLAGQHALQIANGTAPEFVISFRDAQRLLLQDAQTRLRA